MGRPVTVIREAATDNTLLAADGLHPSGKEYERWAEKVAEFFERQDPHSLLGAQVRKIVRLANMKPADYYTNDYLPSG